MSNPDYDFAGTGVPWRATRAGCFDARLPFLATLSLAPLYALVDVAQRFAVGPDTVFSNFFKLPVATHVLAFIGIFLAVWLLWFAILRGVTSQPRRRPSFVERLTEVRAARALLNVYLAVVVGVVAVLTLLHTLDLGVGVQAVLLIFTCVYAELAYYLQARA